MSKSNVTELTQETKPTHTPGEWTFAVEDCGPERDGSSLVGYVRSGLTEIAVLYGPHDGTCGDRPERDANGALIAAAPDLLDALKYTLMAMRHTPACEARIDRGTWACSCGMTDYYDRAQAALARAEGR